MASMMKFTAAALFFVLVASSSIAQAERSKLWIASGLGGGTYRSVYAKNLVTLLRNYESFFRPSIGSANNLDLLVDGKADIAFAQADVYAAKLSTDSERYGSLLVVGKLADECVYIAHRKDGPVKNFEGLSLLVGDRAARIAVGAEGGGMSGTWSYLRLLDPDLATVEVSDDGDTLALNQLAVGAFDAVGWVTDPNNLKHKMLLATMANEELAIMNLNDPELVEAHPGGTQVYDQRKFKLTKNWRAPEVETICTSALMLTRKDADPDLVSKLADVLSLHRDKLVGRK